MGAFVIIVGFILMVIIHEGGHFVAAKAFDMKATQAFFGFGPRIWSIQKGETEYGVKALPLGGYVRIIGMNPFEEVDPEDEGRTYREKPFWQKSVVVLAGIASHMVVAFLIFVIVALVWGTRFMPSPELKPSVGRVVQVVPEPVEVAEPIELDLLLTDVVVSIDGVPVLQAPTDVDKEPGDVTEVVAVRDGETLTLTTTDIVVPSPALLAGALEGDELLMVDQVRVEVWSDFTDAVRARPDQDVVIGVERDGRLLALPATLTSRQIEEEVNGFFGVAPTDTVNLIEAFVVAGRNMGAAIAASAAGLWSLVTNFGDIVGAVIGGDGSGALEDNRPISVIGLVRIAGPLESGLLLLAFVNVFVGVLNVIPLYPLDGGHFAVALYEKIRGRSADVRKLVPVAAAVFIFIVVLGLFGLYLDIVDPLQLPGQ